MNEKVDIEIARRRLTVEMEGLTPMQISSLAQRVTDKMAEISAHNNKIADSSKLAILTALAFAEELLRIKESRDTEMRILERKIDEFTLSLQSTLAVTEPKPK